MRGTLLERLIALNIRATTIARRRGVWQRLLDGGDIALAVFAGFCVAVVLWATFWRGVGG